MKFKVGDKILDEIGEIIQVDKTDMPYLIKYEDNLEKWCFENALEPIPFTTKDLQDGDIVTLRNGDKLTYTKNIL